MFEYKKSVRNIKKLIEYLFKGQNYLTNFIFQEQFN